MTATLFQIPIYASLSAIGFIGNGIVIIVMSQKGNRVKPSSILLTNLAACDFLVSVLALPLDIGEMIVGHWPYGMALCTLVYPLHTALTVVSSWTLLFMFIERYLIFSQRSNMASRPFRTRMCAAATWLLGIIVATPYAVHLHYKGGVCVEHWDEPVQTKVYTGALTIIEYIAPMTGLLVFMGLILRYLRQDKRLVRGNTLGLGVAARRRRRRTNTRLTWAFIVMVTAYLLLKLPNNVLWTWKEFGSSLSWHDFDTTWTTVAVCSSATSSINPVILTLMSRDFRKDMRRLLSRRGESLRSGSLYTTQTQARHSSFARATMERNSRRQRAMAAVRTLPSAESGQERQRTRLPMTIGCQKYFGRLKRLPLLLAKSHSDNDDSNSPKIISRKASEKSRWTLSTGRRRVREEQRLLRMKRGTQTTSFCSDQIEADGLELQLMPITQPINATS